jgi:preprotein translocase subunit SecA
MQEARTDPALAMEPGFASGPLAAGGAAVITQEAARETFSAVARNAPCPCGSGRKYKHCHGSAA